MAINVKEVLQRSKALKSDRENWESHWQEVSEVVLPRRSDFVGPRSRGDKRGLQAIDSTGIVANGLLAAGLHGMLTNPASKWFQLRIPNHDLADDPTIKKWLEEVERIIFSELNSAASGFTSHMHELYMDLTAFGTAIMFVGTDEKGNLTFSTRHLKECFLAEDPYGMIDTLYRRFDYTVRQIVHRWPDSHGEAVAKLYAAKKYDDKLEVLHCVTPRRDKDPKSKKADNLPVASAYILCKQEVVLQEGGFDEMPYMAPRWVKAAGETYGRGPGMDSLPDIKMLQEMAKTVIKAAQKIVDPPLQMEDESVLGPVRTIPGGLNFRRPGSDPIQPLQTGANIPIGLDMMQDLRNRIREGFFIDQLQLNQGPQMTATEVLQRTEEKLRLLGPVLGRLQSELLGPLIHRVFGILSRDNKLPPPPDVLLDVEYNVEYVSPLARAQRQVEANGLLRVFEIGSSVFQIDPTAAQVMNGGDTIRWLGDLFGVPTSLFKSEQEVKQLQEAQQAAQAQAQQMEMMQQGAAAAKDVGSAIRDTK
jgi:hypothetical protein